MRFVWKPHTTIKSANGFNFFRQYTNNKTNVYRIVCVINYQNFYDQIIDAKYENGLFGIKTKNAYRIEYTTANDRRWCKSTQKSLFGVVLVAIQLNRKT